LFKHIEEIADSQWILYQTSPACKPRCPRQKIARQTVSLFENEVISDDNFNSTDKIVSRHCYAVLVQ